MHSHILSEHVYREEVLGREDVIFKSPLMNLRTVEPTLAKHLECT